MMGIFLKMASRLCDSGCGRFLASSDGHDRCPLCLGYQHAEAALVDESCSHCGNRISFEAPADDGRSIAASEVELGFGDDDLAALPPSGRVALPESDPELTAMLSRAAESVGLHWRPPPSPERSRPDDWFLGA